MGQSQGSERSDGYLRITQVRGWASASKKQLKVLSGLGLGRTGRSVVREDTAAIRGMVQRVSHMLEVESVSAEEAGRA